MEVKKATLVSPFWEDFVGQSSACMQKLELTINGRKYFINQQEHLLKEELKALMENDRKYENFTLFAQRPGYLTNDVLNLLKSRQGKWKNVKIWSEKFENIETFFELVEASLENLELRNVKISSKLLPNRKFSFKKLKSLKICNVDNTELFLNIFKDSGNLEFLEIENAIDNSLIKFLETQHKIHKLFITQTKLNDEVLEKISFIESLRLKEFKIKNEALVQSEESRGFARLLKLQNDSLEKLTVDAKCNVNAMAMIFRLRRLKTLHILTLPVLSVRDNLDFPTSKSIVELNVDCHFSLEILLKFLDAVPKLKILKLSCTDKEVIEVIKKRLPGLESFEN